MIYARTRYVPSHLRSPSKSYRCSSHVIVWLSVSIPLLKHFLDLTAGTSKERSANALEQMGPAILNGGITTFLALFFLAFSQSYAFIVFFKVSDYDDYSD